MLSALNPPASAFAKRGQGLQTNSGLAEEIGNRQRFARPVYF
jgi:hypothetical protein